MLRFGFGRKEERDPALTERLKADVRAALSLSEDVALSISEIACADPACPVLETIVLIMEPGKKTRACKAHGAINAMSVEELRAALTSQ
ncbi:MAG: hypothetical protein BGP06_10875 [Rhizobiales bacterium 65-9]|nr:hypothetical protein [Hyphomicrobiales bacterium]OJY32839.1 MAG: hypothetical protein BGP06_10875 [Rhizobiales bacterium 65-9]